MDQQQLVVDLTSGGTDGSRLVRHPTRGSSLILLAADVATMAALAVIFDWAWGRAAGFIGVLLVTLLVRGHYRTRMSRSVGEDATIIAGGIAVSVLAIAAAVTATNTVEPLIETLVAASLGSFTALLAARFLAFRALILLRRRGAMRSRALVVGTGPIAREIGAEFAHRRDYGVDIAGYVARSDLRAEVTLPGPVVGNLDALAALVQLTGSDRVIVTLGAQGDDAVADALRTLPSPESSVFVMPQLFELGLGGDSLTPDKARGFALVRLGRSAHPVIGMRFKRWFDVAASGIALLMLSPLLGAAAAAVKLSSPGPVLFRQARVGRFGSNFELLKFRSMRVNADGDTAWTPGASEGRVTAIGRFLRWSSIDELPQLWNIFRGDMSIVGPRPERPAFVDDFALSVPGYVHRHRLPVGLTGLAQVRGLRGDTPMVERAKYDNLYIDQWSFFGDLAIIARTVWSIVRQGAYAEAEVDLSAAIDDVDDVDQVVIDLLALGDEATAERGRGGSA